MVLVDSQLYGNRNGNIRFKCLAAIAFKPDATVTVTVGLTVNKYHQCVLQFDEVVHLWSFHHNRDIPKIEKWRVTSLFRLKYLETGFTDTTNFTIIWEGTCFTVNNYIR